MFANIASFLWGSSTTPTSTLPSTDDQIEDCSNATCDDVNGDVMSTDCIGELNTAAEATALSSSSLSDEEAGWVFVSNNKPVLIESIPSDKEIEIDVSEPEPVVEEEKKRPAKKPTNNNVPAPKPRNVPSSALHGSSVLNALAELKPQQKAQRRHRELRLKHKQLERSNKAVQVESSSNRPNRRRAMYSPTVSSRAVNNRKC